jgi:hypothetical protein
MTMCHGIQFEGIWDISVAEETVFLRKLCGSTLRPSPLSSVGLDLDGAWECQEHNDSCGVDVQIEHCVKPVQEPLDASPRHACGAKTQEATTE